VYINLKLLSQNLSLEKQEELGLQYFQDFDDAPARNLNKPYWLREVKIAQIVLDSLLFNHSKFYTLWCACIMPNRVQALISTLKNAPTLDVILQNHKKFTRECLSSHPVHGWEERHFFPKQRALGLT
jgi:hypothetical protein